MPRDTTSDIPHVILLHETVRESMARDLGSGALIIGLWSFGWFVGSPALEWLGVVLALIAIVSRAIAKLRDKKRWMTPAEARAWLDEHFPDPA